MKQELLEYLIRHVTREVLKQTGGKLNLREQDEEEKGEFAKEKDGDTKGAASPPEDVKDTSDQTSMQKNTATDTEEPSKKETPTPPPSADLKGVVFVNPKDKAKLQKIKVSGMDDATLERNLHRLAATLAGSSVKIAISTTRAVKDAVKNPNTSVYLYLGKYDPNSEEVFLMADKSLQVAKDASIQPSEMTGGVVSPISTPDFNPMAAGAGEFATRMAQGGQTPVHGLDEKLVKKIRLMVNEILNK